jgi:2-polyprenyl-3-methyl-5-hydroxy-6-metoxy-1,4-benzoquinol methylase
LSTHNFSNFSKSKTSNEVKAIYESSLGIDYGNTVLGTNTSRILAEDPKLLLFTLSRYKFVSKIFHDKKHVLEIGCQEGFGAQIVAKNVESYLGTDYYLPYIEHAMKFSKRNNMEFQPFDILESAILRNPSDNSKFDGVFALDVLEHIDKQNDDIFMKNTRDSLDDNGVMIVGMPTIESQVYASRASKAGHINCKSVVELKQLFSQYYKFVFIFSLNDEVVHTGFWPMSHYVVAIGCGKK